MTKYNFFLKFIKKFNLLINSLLKKYLNKLNFNNLSNIASSNKVFLAFVAFIFLFLTYISIPHIYNKVDVKKELQNQLLERFSLNFNFTEKFDYKFFPRPHFSAENLYIYDDQEKISDIKKIYIFVSLENLFSLNNISVKEVNIENANFNLNKQNSDFFLKLLNNNFKEGNLNIKNSKIFFKNFQKEVLFINKIINMKYYYDPKELKNILITDNKIFNIPYSLMFYNNKVENIFFSKINFNFLKLQIKNEIDYSNDKKNGNIKFTYNKNKSKASYEFDKDYLKFNYFDNIAKPKFFYQGNMNFNPFYSLFKGNTDKINILQLFISNSFFVELFKTEILNNKNLNIDVNINSKKAQEFQNIIDLILKLKIQEGLVDIDNTQFSWNNFIDFEIIDSLLYVSKNHLILDGKLILNIKNYNEIYKFLQISKNLRPEIKKIELDFNYNFDQQIIDFNTIKIDSKINENVIKVLSKVFIKKNKLQNKIYFKNIMKKAITAYVG